MNHLQIRNKTFIWGSRTYLMGILNITPDSFSDGGRYNTLESALAQARSMLVNGADIIDIGGQSTRPGAQPISLEEELNRVIPVIKLLRSEIDLPFSIDTTRAEVARCAIEAGADLINDISGGTMDEQMLPTVAELKVPYCLMHIQGTPENMQTLTDYQNVTQEVYQWLAQRVELAVKMGVDRTKIILDPGIGFAKNFEQNLQLLRELKEFTSLHCPLLVGVSRKSFIGQILQQKDPKQRVWGTASACTIAISYSADILRIHDLPQILDVARVADAIYRKS